MIEYFHVEVMRLKKAFSTFKQIVVRLSAKGLPLMAIAFATVLCQGKLFEPELPEELRK